MSTWRTIAHWPVSSGLPDNQSSDNHDSLALADSVRQQLLTRGLGGDGRVFPVKVEIEPVTEYDDTLDRRYRHGGKIAEDREYSGDSLQHKFSRMGARWGR